MKSIDQRLKETSRQLEMMNHLNGMKIAWDNLVSFHKSMFMHIDLWVGVPDHFAEKDLGVRKLFPCSKWGMKISLIVQNYPLCWYPGLKVTPP